jgi:uncharacterized protein
MGLICKYTFYFISMTAFIRRRILPALQAHLGSPEITLLVGPRQVGKTTLIRMLLRDLEAQGKRCVFFNLDVEEDMHWFGSQRMLLDRLSFLVGASDQTVYVAIDEIQRKTDAGRFMKGLYDMSLPYKFILSGSGSLELKEQIAESMMGRKREFYIAPVSIAEFVDYRSGYAFSDRLSAFGKMEPQKLSGLLIEYLNFGGYPRVITSQGLDEKRAMMREIYTSYVDRDISSLLRLTRPDAYRKMLALLASQCGQLLNLSTLSAQAGISAPTLKNYLHYAEKTFAITLVAPHFRNLQKEISKAPTPYFVDLGLRNLVINRWGSLIEPGDLGFLFQNLVLHLLAARFSSAPVKYWRTLDKAEVDFVVDDPTLGVLPVEVKYTALRHPAVTRSLRSFIDKYQPQQAWVVNLSLDQIEQIGTTEVRFVPLHGLL